MVVLNNKYDRGVHTFIKVHFLHSRKVNPQYKYFYCMIKICENEILHCEVKQRRQKFYIKSAKMKS